LVLVQITRTTPLRRTILQFSQIRRTLALTFMAGNLSNWPEIRRIDNCNAKALTAQGLVELLNSRCNLES